MHENILAAAIPHDEPEPFIGIVPFHRAELLDGGLVRRCLWALGPGTPSGLLLRGAGVDAQDLGYLLTLLARPDPDLKRRARPHRAVTAALDHAHMEERITATGKLNEAKPFLGIVPLDRGLNRRAG